MTHTSISKLWSSGIRRYLRPKELLRGVIAGCRLAWSAVADIDKMLSDNIPVGYGKLYDTIVLPLSYIGKNRNVAGVGHIFSEEFPYIVIGAPSGIIRFSTSPLNLGASKYSEFIEHQGVYYFKHDPTMYGIVNAKNGDICTFLVTCSHPKNLKYQDANNSYCNSSIYSNNKIIHNYDTRSTATNGISNRLYFLSAGVTVPEADTEICRQWFEGGTLYALTTSGELIKDANATKLRPGDAALPAGTSITRGYSDKYALYPGTDGIARVILNCGLDYTISELPELDKVIPELTNSSAKFKFNTLRELLDSKNIVTIDTSNGDADVQMAIARRSSAVSTLFHTQYVDVLYNNELSACLGFPTVEPSYAYLYFDGSSKFSAPVIFAGISPREAILNNISRYTVIRTPLQKTGNTLVATTLNGRVFGNSIDCGMYLKSIILAENDEHNYTTDVILNHININAPVLVKSGRCVVIAINEVGGTDNNEHLA